MCIDFKNYYAISKLKIIKIKKRINYCMFKIINILNSLNELELNSTNLIHINPCETKFILRIKKKIIIT